MPWSAKQQQAINTYHKNILVAAAAGSGKTSVLVERVIQRIIHKTCDINQILVVTFTNAAASEMRERIAKAITNQLPTKDKERQLVLLNAASISTLHAFCQNLLRQYFHQLGLDPKFRLANPQEIELLKIDVLDELFEHNYDLDNNPNFLEFTDTYGSERGDDNSYDIILKLYEYSRSQPFPLKWLKSLPTYFEINDNQSLNDCPWLKIIKESVQDNLNIAIELSNKMIKLAIEQKTPFYEDIANGDLEFLQELFSLTNTAWNEAYTAINSFKFKTMRPPKNTTDEIKQLFSPLRDEIKKIIKQLKETYFSQTLDNILSDMPQLTKQATSLCNLTIEFSHAFAKAKLDRAIIDFSDLEHFTLKLLATENSTIDHLEPSAIAQAIQQKYVEIMVDEYQDTNGVQEAILRLIVSPTTPNLFLVGDVKQSIYKFRLAEPELFLEKYRQYPQKDDCLRIDLAQNFRSRAEILAGINFIFSQIMTEKAGELTYGEKEALYPGFDYPESDLLILKSPIEIALFDKQNKLSTTKVEFSPKAVDNVHKSINNSSNNIEDNDEENLQGFQAEAKYIATRIQKLVDDNTMVFDKNSKHYRPIKWKDIVILLRSVQDKAKLLADVLREANIPVYANIETGYFKETEIQIMLSLLKIIDNPQQDIPLTATLYSPMFNFSTEDLAHIRLANPEGNMYEALLSIKKLNKSTKLTQQVINFLAKLNTWRDYARSHSVPELIWLLLNDTGYYDYVGGLPEGAIRQANLRALYDRASNYEQTSFRGLFRFLRFIHKMQHIGNDLAVARSLSDSEDVVRIMSIHKSKGLEFPVVILADTGKQFNLKDTQENVLFHKKLGLGLYVYDVNHNIRYQNLSRQAITRQIINEYKAEEMRILYVAMTRAREKLIITGSIRDIEKTAQNVCSQLQYKAQTLPDYFILQAKSYLDWILPALSRHQDGFMLRQYAQAQNSLLLNDNSHWQISLINSLDSNNNQNSSSANEDIFHKIQKLEHLPATKQANAIKNRLEWIYPHQEALSIPAKLSVTEIKQQFTQANFSIDENNDNTTSLFATQPYKRPQFLQQQTKLTATEYGSLMHTVMQHLDFHGDLSDKGILAQIKNLADKEIINKQFITKIYRKNIYDFIKSPLGNRIINAVSLQRELAFSRMIKANLYYPQAQSDDTIFVQGVVDLLIEEDDGFILLDYKTDNCSAKEATEKYALQIELYTQAMQEIMRKPIKEKYLYLFHNANLIKM